MSAALKIFLLSASLLIISACAPQHGNKQADLQVVDYFDHQVSFNGETLALIAKWYTGDADNWNEILAHNSGLDVRKMAIGQVIRIPRSMLVKETKLTRNALSSSNKSPTTAVDNKKSNKAIAKPTANQSSEQPISQDSASEKETNKKALSGVLDELNEDSLNETKTASTPDTARQSHSNMDAPSEAPKVVAPPTTLAPQNPPTTASSDSKPKTRYDLLKELLEQKQ